MQDLNAVKKPNDQPHQQERKQQDTKNQQHVLDLQTPNSKPNIKLPAGWISVWSKSQKRWYFFDKKTNKSIWEWPPPGGLSS
mmetsp:Transcript_22970/g.32363  ORF Transcript_22970/g.32363 Transcript_22970/m.32363 type:complete len:82 (-) Transcript_22970:108-353(-)